MKVFLEFSLAPIRSGRTHMLFKIGAAKNFAKFTIKHLCWSLFLIKLKVWRPATLRRDSSANIFRWILRNLWEQFFPEHFLTTTSDQLNTEHFYAWFSCFSGKFCCLTVLSSWENNCNSKHIVSVNMEIAIDQKTKYSWQENNI